MSFIWNRKTNRIIIARSICKWFCVNMAHIKHAVWSGYNHEPKGLKKEQTDLQELENLFFLFPLLKKTKTKKILFIVLLHPNYLQSPGCSFFLCMVSSPPAVYEPCLQLAEIHGDAGFYWCSSSVCLFVAALESLFSMSNFDVWCFSFFFFFNKLSYKEGG